MQAGETIYIEKVYLQKLNTKKAKIISITDYCITFQYENGIKESFGAGQLLGDVKLYRKDKHHILTEIPTQELECQFDIMIKRIRI